MSLFNNVYLAKSKLISRKLLLNETFYMALHTENATQINNSQVPFKPFLYCIYSVLEICFYPSGTNFLKIKNSVYNSKMRENFVSITV